MQKRVLEAKRGCPENLGFWVTVMRSLGSGTTQALVLVGVGGGGGEGEREGREEEPKCPLWRNYKLMQMRKKQMLACQRGNPG